MKNSKEIKRQIDQLDILRVANQLDIKYSARGKFRKCQCFLHKDKHPSMYLKVSNNTWGCPVCNKGGGMVSLVMEHENLTYEEALDWFIQTFSLYVYDDKEPYRPLKSSSNFRKGEQKKVNNKQIQLTVNTKIMNTIDNSLIQTCSSTDTLFCRSLVTTGILTQEQMLHAAQVYHLGKNSDGDVIFWKIDENQQVREGKVMRYKDDCHRDRKQDPFTVSSQLKKKGLLSEQWEASNCFFGQHLTQDSKRIIAIVESEKTAIICSELMQEPAIWLATGGLNMFAPEMFLPLKGRQIILFPDTDPDGKAYRLWMQKAQEAMKILGHPVYVTSLLEKHATEDQKQRKIDLADYLIENR